MTFHLDLPYLNYILDIIKDIEESTDNISEDKFLKNKDIRDANIRRLDIIGETIKSFSKDIKNKYNNTNWDEFIGIKDRVTNQYFGVDFNLIWSMLKKGVPLLKEQILKIKKDFDKHT